MVVSQLSDDLSADQLAGARVRGISNYAVGVDNVDVAAASRRGIAVGNTPGVLTDATADIAMLLILATRRRGVEGDALVRAGGFVGGRRSSCSATTSPGRPSGSWAGAGSPRPSRAERPAST